MQWRRGVHNARKWLEALWSRGHHAIIKISHMHSLQCFTLLESNFDPSGNVLNVMILVNSALENPSIIVYLAKMI